MIDIHNHILPNVDDGSVDMDMSVEMAKIYLNNGFKGVIATPHFIEGIANNSRKDNLIQLEKLKSRLVREELDLELYLGSEVMASLEIVDKLEDKTISTLNDSRYVLIELPMYDIPRYVEDMFYHLQLKGYTPILAHPERNLKIMEDPNILRSYIESGVLTQLNLPSLDGKYGRDVGETSEILLRHHMIHFVSTDAHRSTRRSPQVGNALEILRTLVSEDQFKKLTSENARLVIEDKTIEIEAPIEYKKKKGIFNLFNKNK